MYFDRVEANWPYRIQFPIGSHLPLHCTASGKLLLAHMDGRQRNRLLRAMPLARRTAHTITDPDALIERLKHIKATALGVDNEEFIAGMVAVAVPVFDAAGDVCFTVAVHAPTVRKPLAVLRSISPLYDRRLRRCSAYSKAACRDDSVTRLVCLNENSVCLKTAVFCAPTPCKLAKAVLVCAQSDSSRLIFEKDCSSR